MLQFIHLNLNPRKTEMKNTLIFIAVLAAYALANNANAANVATQCDWNNPGADRYTGARAEALNNYKDIPASIRQILKEKITAHQYDDHITISRIGMTGKQNYSNGRDMHWGQNKMCKGEFSIVKWNYMHTEAALVYTYKGYSIAIPSICGNVFRLDLLAGGSKTTGGVSIPESPTPATPQEETPSNYPEVPQGGSVTPQTSTVPYVAWPSEPNQNSLIPQREREFNPVPPMPSTPSGYIPANPVVPTPIANIPVVPAVPEPATNAMLLFGFCLVVGLTQYKKK